MRFVILLALLVSTASGLHAEESVWKKVGWWEVTYDEDYGGCSAFSLFDEGTGVFIGLTGDSDLFLHFAIAILGVIEDLNFGGLTSKWASIQVSA